MFFWIIVGCVGLICLAQCLPDAPKKPTTDHEKFLRAEAENPTAGWEETCSSLFVNAKTGFWAKGKYEIHEDSDWTDENPVLVLSEVELSHSKDRSRLLLKRADYPTFFRRLKQAEEDAQIENEAQKRHAELKAQERQKEFNNKVERRLGEIRTRENN